MLRERQQISSHFSWFESEITKSAKIWLFWERRNVILEARRSVKKRAWPRYSGNLEVKKDGATTSYSQKIKKIIQYFITILQQLDIWIIQLIIYNFWLQFYIFLSNQVWLLCTKSWNITKPLWYVKTLSLLPLYSVEN
jgi:hypothetical protein